MTDDLREDIELVSESAFMPGETLAFERIVKRLNDLEKEASVCEWSYWCAGYLRGCDEEIQDALSNYCPNCGRRIVVQEENK